MVEPPPDTGSSSDDEYFVAWDANRAAEPGTPLPGTSPRRNGISVVNVLAVLMIAGGVAVAVTAALVGSSELDGASESRRSNAVAQPVVEDGFALWATNSDGTPVRWNACEPIRWVMNPLGAPVGAAADIEAAIRSVEQASGLDFEFVGRTDEAPSPNRQPYQPDRYEPDHWAPVLIAWASGSRGDVPLRDRDRAVAIPVAVGDEDATMFVTGQIVFNRDRTLQPGFGDRTSSLGGTAMHELGHLVGLDHVTDPDQLMFPHPHLGPVAWGDGDRRGLAAVGTSAGCAPVPTPRHVEVTYTPDFGD